MAGKGKASDGLKIYDQLAKQAKLDGKDNGRGKPPMYMDGSPYRVGDEVLEGTVSYYRPAKEWEDDSEDAWRFVVVPRGGGVAFPVGPSTTRAVNRKELA